MGVRAENRTQCKMSASKLHVRVGISHPPQREVEPEEDPDVISRVRKPIFVYPAYIIRKLGVVQVRHIHLTVVQNELDLGQSRRNSSGVLE